MKFHRPFGAEHVPSEMECLKNWCAIKKKPTFLFPELLKAAPSQFLYTQCNLFLRFFSTCWNVKKKVGQDYKNCLKIDEKNWLRLSKFQDNVEIWWWMKFWKENGVAGEVGHNNLLVEIYRVARALPTGYIEPLEELLLHSSFLLPLLLYIVDPLVVYCARIAPGSFLAVILLDFLSLSIPLSLRL